MHPMSHFEHGGSAVSLELLDAISTVAGMADDLLRVEPFLANVVKRVVEQAGQLAAKLEAAGLSALELAAQATPKETAAVAKK